MRVLVLGSGVIGVTSAWYLARAGFDVTVIDRAAGPAQGTSFANAGQISPGYASPWAAPGVPLKALKWLFSKDAPLKIKPGLDPRQYLWLSRMLGQCTAARYGVNKARMLRLARYSQACLHQLCADTGLDYEGRRRGTLQLFRTQAQLDAVGKDTAVLDQHGVPYELLDRRGIVAAEPALADGIDKFTGALRLPDDETGDCELFTRRLAQRARAAGVRFRFNVTVGALEQANRRISGVRIDGGIERADRYVLALGCHTPQLLAPLGMRLPVYPLKGYSLTLPIADATMAPVSTVLDESHKVAITRFDERIRVGGMAEVCGFDLSRPARRRSTLEQVVADIFPHACDPAPGRFWAGLRPATPDGTPVVGATPFDNLYLNTGHGTLGWTMACGSGSYLADLMAGVAPQINTEGLDVSRYRKRPRRQAGKAKNTVRPERGLRQQAESKGCLENPSTSALRACAQGEREMADTNRALPDKSGGQCSPCAFGSHCKPAKPIHA